MLGLLMGEGHAMKLPSAGHKPGIRLPTVQSEGAWLEYQQPSQVGAGPRAEFQPTSVLPCL